MTVITVRCLLIMLGIANADLLVAATIGKIDPSGDVLYVRLSGEEVEAFEAGGFVKVETEVGELSGMILSKKGNRARIKLDAPVKGLVARMEISLVPNDPEISGGKATAQALTSSKFPAAAALNVIRTPVSPWTTYIDTAGRGTTDGSGTEIFSTLNFLTMNTTLQYLFLMGQIQVGPEFSYFQSTNKITNNSTVDGESLELEPVQIKYSLLEFGALAKYMFRQYQPYTLNPLCYLSIGMGSYIREIGESKPQKASVQTIKLGVGAQYFLTKSFAFEADFQYRMDTIDFSETEVSTAGEGESPTDERIKHSLSTMGVNYGLALYF